MEMIARNLKNLFCILSVGFTNQNFAKQVVLMNCIIIDDFKNMGCLI